MFNQNIKNEPQADKRRELLTAELIERVKGGRLHLTPILMESEPFRTNALEVLDGVVVDSGKPQYNAAPPLANDAPPVRLVSILNNAEGIKYNGSGMITTQRDERSVVPGTGHTRTIRVTKNHGHVAQLSQREARQVLVRDGWPIVDFRSKGSRRGTVVELDWLTAEASKPDTTQDVRDLFASVKAGLDAASPPAAPTPTSKGAAREARA